MRSILIVFFALVIQRIAIGQALQTLNVTGSSIEDTFVKGKNNGGYNNSFSNENKGTSDNLKAGAWTDGGYNTYFRILMKFSTATIPTNAIIESATITLKGNNSGLNNNDNNGLNGNTGSFQPPHMKLYQITGSWVENSVDWNNKPTSVATNTVLDFVANEDETLTIDIKNLVEIWTATPSTNYGVELRMLTEGTFRSRNFASSEASNSALRPSVTITYRVVPTVSTFPYAESWESSYSWYNNAPYIWQTRTGTTPTANTGPQGASSGTNYMYTEATSNSPNKEFLLVSPKFALGSGAKCITFDYHMYGSQMGNMNVQVTENNGTSWATLWTMNGDQGDTWKTGDLSLAAYANKTIQVRFRAVTGSGELSDMAVDNIRIQGAPTAPTAGTNGERVGSGSVTLTVNPVPGATGYKWYSTPTGGTPIATTATGTYQTASLTYTTPYYVSAYNAAGESASRYAMQATIKPQVTFQGATALAMGESVTLQAPAGYDSYAWKNAQASIIGTAQTMEISTAGTYTLEATKSSLMTASEPIVITSAVSGQNRNYIVSTTIKVPGITDPAQIETLTVQQRAQQIQYFDGLGRPMQTVVTMGSPTMQDIINPVEYDAFGRQAKQHLPYTLASTAPGTYDASWAANQAATYNTLLAGETTLYAETRFEASPLNRVLEQAAPGDAWKMSTGKTVKFSYQINTAADEVRLWKIANNLPTGTGFYPAGQLYKNVTTDEDGNQSMEFTNKQGQTVLKRVMVDVVNADTTWADTYYVYDIYGQLRTVFPPEATKALATNSWAVTTDILKNWAFTYAYDGRNRMISKQVPGADSVYMVYDKWDRLVLTQDGNQREADKWLFTKYDALNRPILTGIMTSTDEVATLRTTVMSATQRYETFDDMQAYGYTNAAYPSHSSADLLTVTYYDRYDFLNVSGAWTPAPQYDYFDEGLEGDSYGHSYAQPATEHTAVKGQVTGSKTRNLKTGEWIGTITYYDDKYRVIQTLSDNARGGYDRVTNLHDFVGQVLQTKVVHYATDTTDVPQEILRRFVYDHSGRLLATYHQIDDQPEVQLSANGYNELSQLTAKGLHAGAETVAYDYNIRGWLTAISSPLFSQELFYNDPSGLDGQMARYNGNISAMKWGDHLSGNPMGYVFEYDRLNRLKAADHFEGMSASGKFNEYLDYDLNGNILNAQYSGQAGSLIDDMTYTYVGNRMMEVADAVSDTTTFHDQNTSGADFGYDRNGNMILDKNEKIDTIYYNHLNLPMAVIMSQKPGIRDSIVYYHDAAGIKLRQDHFENGVLKMKQEYAGEFYYENDTLKFIQHEEGRVTIQNDQLAYDYNLKDHLGNTRITFSTLPESYTFKATMESENATDEEAYFTNVPETRVSMAAANNTPDGSKAARVESTDPIGPMAMLRVNKGDTIVLSAYAYYEGDGSTDGLISESALLAALLSSYSGASGISEVSAQTQGALADALDFPQNLVPKTNQTNDDAPKAFVNYMYFDVDMNFITSGFKQISTAAQFQKELVQMDPLVMEWDGYVMAYVSNESDELNYVHFDDFTIYQAKTHVVYASNYTPFGMQFGEFERTASEPVRYKFQEQEHDTSTGWIAFKWRNYNRRYKRFFNIDPLSESFYYNSTYAFAENRVVDGRELEGLEWSSIKTENKDGTTHTSLTVKMKVHNKAGLEESALLAITLDIEVQAEKSFTGSDDDGNTFSLNVEFDFDSKINPETDFYMELTPAVVDSNGKEMPEEIKGSTEMDGTTQVNRIQVRTNPNDRDPRTASQITRTGAHEIGHSGGIPGGAGHSEANGKKLESNNLMRQSGETTGTVINGEQRKIISKKVEKEQK